MSWVVNSSSSSYGMASALSGSATTSAPGPSAPAEGKPKSSLATLAERLSGATKQNKLEKVKVDGLVLLKIIKHCTESLPEFSSGTLLGMDVESSLEVTNCFPSPLSSEDADDGENVSFQTDMVRLLQDINVDSTTVGWYRSTNLGSFCTSDLISGMFQVQDQVDEEMAQKSVVLIYDPFQTKRGNLSLKAFRLSEAFMKMYREGRNSGTANSVVKLSAAVVSQVGGLSGDGSAKVATQEMDLTAEGIFEELPIEITNAHLFTVLIDDLKQRNGDRLDVDFDRLNLSTNTYLSSNLEFLVEEADNLAGEQSRKNQEKRRQAKIEQDQIKWILQRRAENQAREERGEALLPEVDATNPLFKSQGQSSQLETLLIQKQISVYTKQMNRFAGAAFSKLYLAGALQGKKIA